MSICHLAPRGRIKGLYEWSLLWEERAAKLLATVDFLQQSINWAGPKQAVYVPLNSECRLACRTFHQRSSGFPWLLFSVLICCIHALAMQKMQRRQMLSFWMGGDIMVLIIHLADTVLHIKPTLALRGCSGHRIPVAQTFFFIDLRRSDINTTPWLTSASTEDYQIVSHYVNAASLHKGYTRVRAEQQDKSIMRNVRVARRRSELSLSAVLRRIRHRGGIPERQTACEPHSNTNRVLHRSVYVSQCFWVGYMLTTQLFILENDN